MKSPRVLLLLAFCIPQLVHCAEAPAGDARTRRSPADATTGALGRETLPVPRDFDGLAKVADALAATADVLKAKAAAFSAVVETEAAAGRITETEADDFRWVGANLSPPTNVDSRELLATVEMVRENLAISTAIKAFEIDAEAVRAERSSLAKSAAAFIARKSEEIISTLPDTRDLPELIRLVDRMDEEVRKVSPAGIPEPSSAVFANTSAFLQALARLFAGAQSKYQAEIETEIRRFEASAKPLREILAFRGAYFNVGIAVRRLYQPDLAMVQEAQERVQEDLLAGKPSAQVLADIAKLEKTARKFVPSHMGYQMTAYKRFAELKETLETGGSPDLLAKFTKTRKAAEFAQFWEKQKTELLNLVDKWEKEPNVQMEKMRVPLRSSVWQRLKEAQKPSDLDALCANFDSARINLNRMDPNPPLENMTAYNMYWMRQFLIPLASAWRSGDLNLIPELAKREQPDALADFSGVLAELVERVQRKLLSSTLRIPALDEPPLNQLPPGKAISALCEDFVAKKDWQGVLRLGDIPSKIRSPEEARPQAAPLMAAVSAFVSGQNFERAGEWGEAAQEYMKVLREGVDAGPAEEAAARIKALKKEHPEAFRSTPIVAEPGSEK